MSRSLLVDYAKPEIRIELAEDLGRLSSGGLSKPGRLLRGGLAGIQNEKIQGTGATPQRSFVL